MAKPGSDRDGAMVDKPSAGKKSKDKLSPFTKTPKLDRSEILGKEAKAKSSMKRKLSFSSSPPPSEPRADPRGEERDSDTDKDGPDKKRLKKESGGRKSQSSNLLFGYPLSERKQMALLMQMTANSPDSTPSHPSQTPPVQKKVPLSRQKDKVNKRNERGETPLHMAAIRGDAKQVKELISLGADVNVKDFAGWTPLHEACNLGYYDVAKVLIAAGAEVNTQGLDDDTPLHDASSSGHKDIVKLLLRHGGNAFQANKCGERPVDVADSQELEQLLKGELPLSEPDESSSDSEDPPSVIPSSIDDNMDDSDTEKDLDGKPKSSNSNVPGLDEYEFKDEEEEEDLSKALNERHILRRELRQREKEDKERNHVKPGGKGDKPKKQKSSHAHCSSDTSSDEMESLPDKRNSPTCSQNSDTHKSESRSKKDDQKLGKVKRKSKSRNKENQEDGKENSKTLVLSLAAVSETSEKIREEDSFKMSFSPKDDSSVHLFHFSSIKSPKLTNHNLTDKQTPLKQENIDKYNHCTESDYCIEGSSKGCKHKEKIKHQQKDTVECEDEHSSSYNKDVGIVNSLDSSDGALRKTDTEGKVVKKHKLKHKEKDKHRRDYDSSRHKLKEARKDGHRNLEFDREFWKENFFKSDDTEDAIKKEGEELKIADLPLMREERKHSSSKEKRSKEEKERKKERKEEKFDGHSSARTLDESILKEEIEEKAVTADLEQLDASEKREKSDKKIVMKEGEKTDRKYLDKEKKIKSEHSEDRWKERDKSYKENEKLKLFSIKRHEDCRKSKDKMEKRSDRESTGEHREHRDKDRSSSDRKNKLHEKSSDHSKSERSKDKDCDKKRRDKPKESSNSSSSNLKLLLEEKRGYISESGKLISGKPKEDAMRTPEKDRDRRDRDRDSERHKERDKERHKDRTPLAKPNKPKTNENDPEKAKLKGSPATQKDSKPKEKRLVNDDLMQTSFERMLSLKDQEIEQWHRKHMEKIKQKERERLKQRPVDSKHKLKDRTKPDSCLSKELMRSKSSDAQEGKGLREGPTQRTVSLDGKNLQSMGAKVMSVVENCLTRSPRPDNSDLLMSRSVSMISVASSEDSSHATILTPKHPEYDSDMNCDASDSQSAFLQSSLVIQATRSPSIHDNSGGLDSNRATLPIRHESPCLRAILDEEASSEPKMVENIPIINVTSEEARPKDAQTEGDLDLNMDTQLLTFAPDIGLNKDASNSPSKDVSRPPDTQLSISFIEPQPSSVCDVQSFVEKLDCKDQALNAPAVENVPIASLTEPIVNADKVEFAEQKDKAVDRGDRKDHLEDNSETIISSANSIAAYMPSKSNANIPASTPVESLPGFCDDTIEDLDVDINDNKKSKISLEAAVDVEEKIVVPSEDTRQQVVSEVEGNLEKTIEDLGISKSDDVELMDVETLEEKTETQTTSEDQQLTQNVADSSSSSTTSGSSSPQSGESDSSRTKSRSSDEEIDLNVQHPRKRKMPKMPTSHSGNPHDKEQGQQSLAAIVDAVKLEEIEPYQTERANPYYEFLHIRRKIEEKRKVLCSVIPQPPQYYDEYVTFNGSYLLDGNPLSKLCIPTITPPPSLPEQLKEMFKQQEVVRMKLRLQHSIEREKLIVSNEQEVLRVHYRAARTLANQTLPFSACTVLLDAEVYNMPQDVQSDDGKTSVRDRFNARQFMSWLQDVDDKFDKLKTCLLMRQQHEAAALNAVQRLEWQLKLQELDPAMYKSTSIFEIPEFYIPLVEVNDDFDLTPI
ncbi:unnamed protein product [Knipowitschia caucasica]